ncbi:hypothetical protein [Actinophytocola sp.]|uniref:hypothetical protein n=1 Tax=Actinophytocola sp. TaxID=1872138 RepID=UPI002ED5202B
MAALTLVCLAGAGQPAGAGEADPAPSGGGVGIRLLDAPVSRRDDPRASRYIVDHLSPGTVIQRRVLVANASENPYLVELYPAAAMVERGRFVFGADRLANDLSSWMSVEPAALDLAPGEEMPAVVTVNVPRTASAGERYAVVWASVASEPERPGYVRQVQRIGVRVYLEVGMGGESPSTFGFGPLRADRDVHGFPMVSVKVVNTGGRALDLSGTAELTDGPAGTRAGPFKVPNGTTLGPGQSSTVTVRFPRELPDGPWTIAVHLESGTVKNSMTARITFAGSTGEPVDGPAIPWLAIVGTALGIALLMVSGLVRRGRRSYSHVPDEARTPPMSA